MLTDRDAEMLKRQLGRTPRGVVGVVVRAGGCNSNIIGQGEGEPVVILNYPLQHCQSCEERLVPFPTLYWLTCPRLSRELADMERNGAIEAFQNEIVCNSDLEHAIAKDHRDYIEKRWNLLTKPDRDLVSSSPTLLETLRTRGIGGISNFMMVKCLHLHYAHHLAMIGNNENDESTGTAVGKMIEDKNPDLAKLRNDFVYECVG